MTTARHLREMTVIRALLRRGDPRAALRQIEVATDAIRWRRTDTSEQLRLPTLPVALVTRPDDGPSPLKQAKHDCRTCPHRNRKPQPHDTRKTNGGGLRQRGAAYDSPWGRVVEACIAVADCGDDPAAWKAAKERVRQACEAWLRKETT